MILRIYIDTTNTALLTALHRQYRGDLDIKQRAGDTSIIAGRVITAKKDTWRLIFAEKDASNLLDNIGPKLQLLTL